jgi:DNA-binding MarR family transcriptional regulator
MDQPDLFDISRCACGNLRLATRAVTQLYDEFLKPTGLRTTQLTVLFTVGIHGKSTVTELTEAMMMEHTSMTRALDVLKRQGLIESVPDDEDKRKRIISLTAEGERMLEIAAPLREQAQAKMISELGSEDLYKALELISKMAAAAQNQKK